MKNTLKYILLTLCGTLLVLCIACSFVAGRKSYSLLRCKKLEVCIKDSLENSFVSKDDVKMYLEKEYGEYIGLTLDSLDLVRMEEVINSRSAVHQSQAYFTKDGTLHIEVTQRKPVVRFQKNDGGFYADNEGFIFPLQRSFASHVQIIDGYIPLAANSGYKGEIKDPAQMEWFRNMMNLVNFIEESREWKGKIVQIHIDRNSDIILVPREGKEKFIFGQATQIEDKFGRMERYYKAIVPEKGQDAYRMVDLRYKGQIVCK